MKTKLFTLFLALMTSAGATLASDTQVDGIWYDFDDSNNTASVTYMGNESSTYSYSGSVIIPPSVDYNGKTYSVTSIGNEAFEWCWLTSIEIPNSITSIGDYAFYRCYTLTSISIPNSVTSIGACAFGGCEGLTSPVYNAHVFAYLPTSYAGAYTIPHGVKSIAGLAFSECYDLTSVEIPNTVVSIGFGAFNGCSDLTSVEISNSVSSIGDAAFVGCKKLTSVTCFAVTPPEVIPAGEEMIGIFFGLDCSHISLYVPGESIMAYQEADQWNNLNPILPISAKPIETTTTIVSPSDNSADITWPSVINAASYELVIKDKSGNVICTLVFNGQGQLLSISYNAPARDNSEQQTQTAGFQFTITGLESGTDYDFTITAKDDNGSVLNTENGSFKTTGESQGFDEVQTAKDANKILHNGQILILRGDKVYTVTGQEVK